MSNGDYGLQLARLDQRDEDILRRLASIEGKLDDFARALNQSEVKVAKVSGGVALITALITALVVGAVTGGFTI